VVMGSGCEGEGILLETGWWWMRREMAKGKNADTKSDKQKESEE